MIAFFKKHKRFGEIAVAKGLITKWQLEQVLKDQKEAKSRGVLQKKIGSILLEKGYLEFNDVKGVLEEQKKSAFWSWFGAFTSFKHGI